jgi:hypothetical protein
VVPTHTNDTTTIAVTAIRTNDIHLGNRLTMRERRRWTGQWPVGNVIPSRMVGSADRNGRWLTVGMIRLWSTRRVGRIVCQSRISRTSSWLASIFVVRSQTSPPSRRYMPMPIAMGMVQIIQYTKRNGGETRSM